MRLRNALVGDGVVDILVRDGLIAAITPSSSASEPGDGESIELEGRPVLPGLWDNHTHFDQWALTSFRLDVSGAISAGETATLIAAAVGTGTIAAANAGDVFVAIGFRDGLWPDVPSRATLDAASRDPVVVISGDLHAAWLNSAALVLFGHADHPTGLLREDEAFAVVSHLDAIGPERLDQLAIEAARRAATRGIVGIVDYEMTDNALKWQRRSNRYGPLPLRVEFGIYREHLDAAIERGLRTGDRLSGSDRVRVGNLKIIIDGSLNTRTANCYDDYPGLAGADAAGLSTVAPDELFEVIERAAVAGIAASVHAIGDRANSIALDAFERLRGTGRRVAGNRIEHAQLIADADRPRFAALDVAASVQPDHAMDDRDVADRYWAGRTARAFPLRLLLDAGAQLMLGSDAPVSRLDPFLAIQAAVSRTRDGREPWHPEQAIGLAEAVAASSRSSVAVGQPADLVVLESALDGADARAARSDLATTSVAATLLAGEFTHRAI